MYHLVQPKAPYHTNLQEPGINRAFPCLARASKGDERSQTGSNIYNKGYKSLLHSPRVESMNNMDIPVKGGLGDIVGIPYVGR